MKTPKEQAIEFVNDEFGISEWDKRNMKKIVFKIISHNNSVMTLVDVNAEEYDEFVYYVSPRMNKDLKISYSLYDKKTGLLVCSSTNKKTLIDSYKYINKKYAKIRESEFYQIAIKQYERVKKEVNV